MRQISKHPCAAFLAASVALALPVVVRAAPCPNYPFPPHDDRCVEHGFCARVRPDASAGETTHQPDPTKTVDSVPVVHYAGASAGTVNPSASGVADASAGRGFVQAVSSADGAAPATTDLEDSLANARTSTAFRVTDLVFSGPTAEVETSLHLVFEPSYSMTTNGEDADGRTGVAAVRVGGGICGAGQIVAFEGERQVSLVDVTGGAPTLSFTTGNGLLTGALLDVPIAFSVGPFSVPTGVPLQIELWMLTTTSVMAEGGVSAADSTFRFSLPLDGSPVFDLPAGYSADSPDAGIVANIAAEPHAILLSLSGAMTLLSVRRSARRGS